MTNTTPNTEKGGCLSGLTSLGCLVFWVPFGVILAIFISGLMPAWQIAILSLIVGALATIIYLTSSLVHKLLRKIAPVLLKPFAFLGSKLVRMILFVVPVFLIIASILLRGSVTQFGAALKTYQVQSIVSNLCETAEQLSDVTGNILTVSDEGWPDGNVWVTFNINGEEQTLGKGGKYKLPTLKSLVITKVKILRAGESNPSGDVASCDVSLVNK